jgi:hypothetical protein
LILRARQPAIVRSAATKRVVSVPLRAFKLYACSSVTDDRSATLVHKSPPGATFNLQVQLLAIG